MKKIIAAVLVIVIIIAGFFIFRRRQEAKAKQAQVDAAWAQYLQRQMQEESLKSLSPAEHLKKAQALLKFGNTDEEIGKGFRQLGFIYPTAPEYEQAKQLVEDYEAAKRQYDQEQEHKLELQHKQEAEGEAQFLELSRQSYPSEFQAAMLQKGSDMTARVSGPHNEKLTIEWVLMDSAFVTKFLDSDPEADKMNDLGFTEIVFVNPTSGKYWKYSPQENAKKPSQ